MSWIPALSERTWKIIGGLVLGLIVIGGILFFASKCSDWRFNRGMTKANANLANAFNALANIQDQKVETEKQLANIKVEEAVQKEKVAEAARDAEAAANAEREAQIAANQAVANVNAINAKDFSNSSLSNANRARCLAFPDGDGCR